MREAKQKEDGMSSWKGKKEILCKLIKKLSDAYGGDDIEWLREYARDVCWDYNEKLDEAIACFSSLMVGAPKTSLETKKNGIELNLCGGCGYRILFCSCVVSKECSKMRENVLCGTIGEGM